MNFLSNLFSRKEKKQGESKAKEEEDIIVEKLFNLEFKKVGDDKLDENLTLIDKKFEFLISKYNPNYREIDYRYEMIIKNKNNSNISNINSTSNTYTAKDFIKNNNEANSEKDYSSLNLKEDDTVLISKNESNLNNLSDNDKMKEIGKIYISDDSSLTEYSDSREIRYNNSRFEAISNFPTIKSKNCVFKGKWFYEVRIITNKLFQIGWVRNLNFILVSYQHCC
jgi:hypothetical protein